MTIFKLYLVQENNVSKLSILSLFQTSISNSSELKDRIQTIIPYIFSIQETKENADEIKTFFDKIFTLANDYGDILNGTTNKRNVGKGKKRRVELNFSDYESSNYVFDINQDKSNRSESRLVQEQLRNIKRRRRRSRSAKKVT